MDKEKENIDYVVCRLCQKRFKEITNTHLKRFHNMTVKEYWIIFPNANTESENVRKKHGDKLRNKSYAEIYGKERAKQICKRRSKTLIETYKKNVQLRKDRGISRKKYCEDEKMKKGLKKSICKVCHKEYWYNPKEVKGIYCSKKCRDKDHKEVALNMWKTKRAGEKTVKTKIIEERGKICEKCGKEFKRAGDLCLHHLTYDYYSEDSSYYILLCKSCHVKLHNKIRREERGFLGTNQIKKSIHQLLKSLRISIDDPNFRDTPMRVSRMYSELCSGLFLDFEKEVKEVLSTVFPSEKDEMIIYEGTATGMCPHHLLPVMYKFHIGIVPKKYVVGASKPQRLVEIFCSIPDLQENITTKVKDTLSKILKPQGVFVLLEGEHMCMRIRGVKSSSSKLTTSAIGGCFTEVKARAEFLSLIKK